MCKVDWVGVEVNVHYMTDKDTALSAGYTHAFFSVHQHKRRVTSGIIMEATVVEMA